MRILDKKGNELEEVDYELGYVEPERIVSVHHEAVEAVEEEYHLETVREYENGGKDVIKVVDVEYQPAKPAWDEYEDILRYIPFTKKQLADRKKEREEIEKQVEEANRIAQEKAQQRHARDEWVDSAKEDIPDLQEYRESVDTKQLDTDELLVEMYTEIQNMRLDTDEALVGLYEAMTATPETEEE